MQIRIIATTETDVLELEPTPFVLMKWEEKFDKSALDPLSNGFGYRDLIYLAWETAKLSQTVPPLDQFAKQLLDVRAEPKKANHSAAEHSAG